MDKFYSVNEVPIVRVLYGNMQSLRHLLEKPHVIETTGQGPESKTWQSACELCMLLGRLIKVRKPNYRGFNMLVWATDMDRIMTIDNRTRAQVAELIQWCQQHSFWQNNILSPAKLRKQLDALELQMADDVHWQRGKLKRRVQEGPTEREKYLKGLEDGSNQGDAGRGN